jgi:hypothetical protein
MDSMDKDEVFKDFVLLHVEEKRPVIVIEKKI